MLACGDFVFCTLAACPSHPRRSVLQVLQAYALSLSLSLALCVLFSLFVVDRGGMSKLVTGQPVHTGHTDVHSSQGQKCSFYAGPSQVGQIQRLM